MVSFPLGKYYEQELLFAEGGRTCLYESAGGRVYHDFLRAGVDPGAALVTPETCDAAVVGVADTAHDLHRVVDDLEACLAGVSLEQGCVNAELLAVLLLPCAAEQHVVHVVALDLHVAQLLLDDLELADRLAELLAGGRICQSVVVCAHCHADVGNAGEKSLGLEVLHELVEALALGADECGLFKLDVVEVNFAGGHAVAADLIKDGDLDAGGIQRNEVPGHVLVRILVFILAGNAHHVRCNGCAGIEGLVAVDVYLAVNVGRSGGHAAVVGTGLRLGEAESVGLDAFGSIADYLLLLLGGAVSHDVVYLEAAAGDSKCGPAVFIELELQQNGGDEVKAVAAELGGMVYAVEACLYEILAGFLGVLVLAVTLFEILIVVTAFEKLFCAFKQQLLLLSKFEINLLS